MKLLFIDEKMPAEAVEKLAKYGEPVKFSTTGLTYDPISGHPDIFFTKVGNRLIVAPNLPKKYKQLLNSKNIDFTEGVLPVGRKYPESSRYNVVAVKNFLFHNFRYTDSSITDAAGDRNLVHINQGYARCGLIPLDDKHFITSDKGIAKVLDHLPGIKTLLVNPEDILLEGHRHGFIGGTAGVDGKRLILAGSLDHFNDGKKIREFIKPLGTEIIELYNGPLFDGGSIFVIN
jgi:hypothetical protein